MKLIQTTEYLLLIDEEAEIKVDDYVIDENNQVSRITENVDFINAGIKDGIFCKIIAYYPLKEAKELDLSLLPLKGLWTEEGEILEDDGNFVHLQNGKKYKKSELELWVENT